MWLTPFKYNGYFYIQIGPRSQNSEAGAEIIKPIYLRWLLFISSPLIITAPTILIGIWAIIVYGSIDLQMVDKRQVCILANMLPSLNNTDIRTNSSRTVAEYLRRRIQISLLPRWICQK